MILKLEAPLFTSVQATSEPLKAEQSLFLVWQTFPEKKHSAIKIQTIYIKRQKKYHNHKIKQKKTHRTKIKHSKTT
jgi:hypothetical protein